MIEHAEYGSAWADEPPPLVRWWSCPVRDNILSALVVLAGLTAAGMGVHAATGRLHLALFAVLVLTMALWRFFIPVLFELNTDGVNQWVFRRHRRISWNEIHRYDICSKGVLLLPHTDRCPMDAFRGLYLPWRNRREEVLAQIHYYLDPPEE
jgi:hypothetical protein